MSGAEQVVRGHLREAWDGGRPDAAGPYIAVVRLP